MTVDDKREPTTIADEALVVDLRHLSATVRAHPLALELPPAWVEGALAGTDAVASAPGHLALELQLVGTSILIRGRLKVSLEIPCARCLEPSAVVQEVEICVQAVRSSGPTPTPRRSPGAGEGDDVEEEEVDLEAPDTILYVGTSLDLRPLITEQVAMAYPMRALCRRGEACRGLCPSCGANLNETDAAICPLCSRGVAAGEVAEEAPVAGGRSPWRSALASLLPEEPES